jgi:hypothetical protein
LRIRLGRKKARVDGRGRQEDEREEGWEDMCYFR